MKKTGEKLYKGIPKEIEEFVKYSKNLKFEQDPDYSYLRSLFTTILMSFTFNYRKLAFSWIKSKDEKLLGIPRNRSFRKSSPHYRILQSIKERKKKQLSSKGLKLNNMPSESNDNNNIYEKLINQNKINKEKTEKSINIKNFINSESKEINSKKQIELNNIKRIPLQPKKAIDKNILSLNNISNFDPILINKSNTYISRNIKNLNNKIFKNNNQKSYININFYTNNTIFQRDGKESRFNFNHSNNSYRNRYSRSNNNNENLHLLNNISNTKEINYDKKNRNKNNNVKKYILIRNKNNQNNSNILFDKNDKILNSRNEIKQQKVNSYIPFNIKNNIINYDIKNEQKLFFNKMIKKIIQPIKRQYQNSSIPSSSNNEINSKILNQNNLKTFQSVNNFNYSTNINYRKLFFNDYNQKINLRKYIYNSGGKNIYKDMNKSEIDLFRNKIKTNVKRNNKNQILESFQNDIKANYLNNNYVRKDNYLPMRKYSKIRMSNSYSINLLNNKSMRNNYNFNSSDNNNFF
jgi:hypothetical protein